MGQIIRSGGIRSFIVLALCLCALVSCSKDSHDELPVVTGDNVLNAESLTFGLQVIEDDPLEITIEKSSKIYTATLETVKGVNEKTEEITGTYDFTTRTWGVNAYPRLNVTATDALEDSFFIQIMDPLKVAETGYPSAGRMKIISRTLGTIAIVFKDPQNLDIVLDSGNAVPVAWSGLLDILGSDDAPGWQKEAALACCLINYLVTEAGCVLDTVCLIEQNEDAIADKGSLAFDSDEFPGVPPEGVSKKGSAILSFTDLSGDTKAGPGDDFTWTYFDSWDASQGKLSVGTVYLVNYLREVQTTGGIGDITGIGFPPADGGGVIYDYVTRQKTGSASPQVIDHTITLNGGFSIVFEK